MLILFPLTDRVLFQKLFNWHLQYLFPKLISKNTATSFFLCKKNSEIFECFEMVSFLFFFSFLFWAPNLYLKVDILLKQRKFIPDWNNCLIESFILDSKVFDVPRHERFFCSQKEWSLFVSFNRKYQTSDQT